MKFTCAAEIDAPLEKVVRLFENPDNLNKWITGLVSFTHKSGTPGQPGAKSEIVIQAGKQKIELLETIISNSLPHELTGLYEHKHMVNTTTNRFTPIGNDKTIYETEVHYTKFIGIVPKVISVVMPGMFRKQVQLTVDNFKKFVESEK